MNRFVYIPLRSVRDFFRDGGMTHSASLAFFTMTAIVPMCIFFVTVLGYILGENQDFFNYFTEKLVSLFPRVTAGITSELKKLIAFRGIGKISLVLYAFLSFQLYAAINKSLEAVFKIRQKRSLPGTVVLSILVVTLLFCLLIISFALISAVPLLKALKPYIPWLRIGIITSILVRFVLPFLLIQSAAMIVYTIVPKRRVRIQHAFWGGMFTAFMLEIAKRFFTWYMVSVVRMGTIYGSLAAFVMFLLWTYYSSAIFLIGGEIVHNLGDGKVSPYQRRRVTDI